MTFPESLGIDFYCESDISDDWAYENDPVRAYVQACFRRLEMQDLFYALPPRKPEDPSRRGPYGAGIFRFILESGVTSAEISGAIVDALLLDERTENVEIAFEDKRMRIHVTPRDAPDFRFTIEADLVSGVITGNS